MYLPTFGSIGGRGYLPSSSKLLILSVLMWYVELVPDSFERSVYCPLLGVTLSHNLHSTVIYKYIGEYIDFILQECLGLLYLGVIMSYTSTKPRTLLGVCPNFRSSVSRD